MTVNLYPSLTAAHPYAGLAGTPLAIKMAWDFIPSSLEQLADAAALRAELLRKSAHTGGGDASQAVEELDAAHTFQNLADACRALLKLQQVA